MGLRLVPVATIILVPLAFYSTPANPQSGKKLSAREIFYSAPKAASPTKEVPTPRRHAPPEQTAPVKPDTPPAADVSSASTARPSRPAPPVKEDPPPPTGPADVKYVTAAATETLPLGMRYSILKRVGSGQVEVDPDTTFRAGDRIRVRVEVNDTGYLYIINRGSSGIWKPLFPSPEIGGGSNVVSRGRSYDIPPEHLFTFDEQAGEEKLFIVFCRQPVADLENLIYELSGPGQRPAEAKPPAADPQPKMLLAQNMVDIRDDFVGRFRNAYARDLIIENVDPDTPGPMKETAVYAVSASAAPDSRVVVDVSLDHR